MSPAAADDQYAQAIEDFDALRQLLPKFRSARAWLRDGDHVSHRIKSFVAPGVQITKGVVRDNAVCALANKGCNTHASVRMLTDASNSDDAMVLARVLLETAVIFCWMMIDQPYRLDLYCLSSALFKRRWTQLAVQHFSHESRLVADAKAALSAEESAVVKAAFGNVAYRWTRERQLDGKFVEYSFEAMLKDIQQAEGTSATNDFIYDVSYFMHSAHAHATADGMRQFKTLGREQFFTCQLGFNDGNCTLALRGANTYLCWLLGHVAAYLGLRDIEGELGSVVYEDDSAAKRAEEAITRDLARVQRLAPGPQKHPQHRGNGDGESGHKLPICRAPCSQRGLAHGAGCPSARLQDQLQLQERHHVTDDALG